MSGVAEAILYIHIIYIIYFTYVNSGVKNVYTSKEEKRVCIYVCVCVYVCVRACKWVQQAKTVTYDNGQTGTLAREGAPN
jgi:hypothetical protein